MSNRLITGLIVLRNNVEQIYKYLRVIASQEVDPIMIPPPPLRELLAEAEKEMAHNPRLELPYKIDTDIYKILYCDEDHPSGGRGRDGHVTHHPPY